MSQPPSEAIANSDQGEEVSPRAIEVLKTLDSRCFGFLGFHNEHRKSGKKADHISEATFVSKELIRKGINRLMAEQSRCVGEEHAVLYCRLGHLHLLLEDYTQALSAYQHYQSLAPKESVSNANFLYGLALIYFHMNSYKWSKDLFYKVLRVSPSFARASEVYLRLGVIFKRKGDYNKSMENFKKALTIPGPSSFNKLEIQYHVGHLHYLQGNYVNAKKSFEGILSSKAVPNVIKAKALRQLGWMFHTIQEVSNSSPNPHAKATELLKLSVGADPNCPQAWYFLGRCHAHEGRDRDAFLAYQHAITKSSDGQADIWCSIGLLYQKLNQPRDSLQSYLCAVYMEPHNMAGWINLGCLYEAAAQPVDALLSYKNACHAAHAPNSKYSVKCLDFVNARVRHLEQLASTMCPSMWHQPHSLPSLQQAWHSRIPANVRSKVPVPPTPILRLSDLQPPAPGVFQFPSYGSVPHHFQDPMRSTLPPLAKKPRLNKAKDPIIIRNINDGWNTEQQFQHPPPPPVGPRLYPSPNSPCLTPTVMTPMADSPGSTFFPGPSHIDSDAGIRSAGMGPSPIGVGSMDPYYQRPGRMMDSSVYDANSSYHRPEQTTGYGYNSNSCHRGNSSAPFYGNNNSSVMMPASLPGMVGVNANMSSPMLPLPPPPPPRPRNPSTPYPQYGQQLRVLPSLQPVPAPQPTPAPTPLEPQPLSQSPQNHHSRQHRPENLQLHPLSANIPETTSPALGMQKPMTPDPREAYWHPTITPHQHRQPNYQSPTSLTDLSASAKLIVTPPSVLGVSLPLSTELQHKVVSEPVLSPSAHTPFQHHIETSANHTTLEPSSTSTSVMNSPGTDTSSPYQPPPSSIGDNSVFDSLTPPQSLHNRAPEHQIATGPRCYSGTSSEKPGLNDDMLMVEPLGKTPSEIERIDRYLREYAEQTSGMAGGGPGGEETGAQMDVLGGSVHRAFAGDKGTSGGGNDRHPPAVGGQMADSAACMLKSSSLPSQQQLQVSQPSSLQSSSSPLSSSCSQPSKRRSSKRRLSSQEDSCKDALLVVQSPLNQVLIGPELTKSAELLVEVSANIYSQSPQGEHFETNSNVGTSETTVSIRTSTTHGGEEEKLSSLKRHRDEADTSPSSKKRCREERLCSPEGNAEDGVMERTIEHASTLQVVEAPSMVVSLDLVHADASAETGGLSPEAGAGVGDVEMMDLLLVQQEVEVGADASHDVDENEDPFSPEYVDQATAQYCDADFSPEGEQGRAGLSPSSSVGGSAEEKEPKENEHVASSVSLLPHSGISHILSPPAESSSANQTSKNSCLERLSAHMAASAYTQVEGSSLPTSEPSIISSNIHLARNSTSERLTGKEQTPSGFNRRDREVLSTGEVSDSGVSSSGTKQSTLCSSGDNSPLETMSPTTLTAGSYLPCQADPAPPKRKSAFKPAAAARSVCATESGPCPASVRLKNLLEPLPEPFPSLATNAEYMVQEPDLTPPGAPETKDGIDLHPEVEIYGVKSKEDAFSMKMHAFCSDPDRPICLLRNLCSVLDLNIGLFSSPGLTRCCPDHEIEVRDQIQQAADENLDSNGRRQVWKCESSRSSTTILEYARYQAKVLLGQEDSPVSELSDYPSSDGTSGSQSRPPRHTRKMIKFGTNVDLSDKAKWKVQLQELSKLPKFLRVACPEADFLSHIGHTILGMNSVQLYMKVPGSRTPGHQENNNFCSLNINIGPGDCEWFAVHNQYWGVFHRLCETHKLNFLTGSWWPILSELEDLKVPVYRFTQHMGDVVWLNPGTVHWVQANSVCNNIAWNIGPLTAHQFRMSWERYQWNKIQKVRSIVPMVHLTWNLVQRVKITNKVLYQQLSSLLESSLTQSSLLLDHLHKAGIPVHWHGKETEEPAPSCTNCLDEVFNILFVMQHHNKYLVYCHKCAMALKKSFTVLQQFNMKELGDILASFRLHTPISSPDPSVSL